MLLLHEFRRGKLFRKIANESERVGQSEIQSIQPEQTLPTNSTFCEPTAEPNTKKKKPFTKGSKSTGQPKTRFKWQPELLEGLVDCRNDEKTNAEFKGLDFEADLVTLYGNIRMTMAEKFVGKGFGVANVKGIAEGLETKELAIEKLRYQKEQKEVRTGYDRVKSKCKEIRQDYRAALATGKRSGSSQFVYDNWEKLQLIWGGCPASTAIENSLSSLSSDNTDEPNEFDNWEFNADDDDREDDEMSEGVCSQESVTVDSTEEGVSANANDRSSNADQQIVHPTKKYVDNKRKNNGENSFSKPEG